MEPAHTPAHHAGDAPNYILKHETAISVSRDKAVLILHVKCSSTRAIGYTESSGNPRGQATRAQAATILMRFAEKLALL